MSNETLCFINHKSMLKYLTLDERKHNGAWCNGSTADFESVDLGSNPSAPAKGKMANKYDYGLNEKHLARYFINK